MAELVDAHGSGSCRLSLWEFDSPPRHQRQERLAHLIDVQAFFRSNAQTLIFRIACGKHCRPFPFEVGSHKRLRVSDNKALMRFRNRYILQAERSIQMAGQGIGRLLLAVDNKSSGGFPGHFADKVYKAVTVGMS